MTEEIIERPITYVVKVSVTRTEEALVYWSVGRLRKSDILRRRSARIWVGMRDPSPCSLIMGHGSGLVETMKATMPEPCSRPMTS